MKALALSLCPTQDTNPPCVLTVWTLPTHQSLSSRHPGSQVDCDSVGAFVQVTFTLPNEGPEAKAVMLAIPTHREGP